MSDYRTADAVPVTIIPLKALNGRAIMWPVLLGLPGGVMVALVGGLAIGTSFGPLAQVVFMLAAFAATGAILIRAAMRANVHHFDLEVGATFVCLRLPTAETIADTRSDTLSFARCTYIRRSRASAYVRPGWQMRQSGNPHVYLLGGLWGEDAFENVPRDERIPDFELDRAQFEAFKHTVDSLTTAP